MGTSELRLGTYLPGEGVLVTHASENKQTSVPGMGLKENPQHTTSAPDHTESAILLLNRGFMIAVPLVQAAFSGRARAAVLGSPLRVALTQQTQAQAACKAGAAGGTAPL